MAMTIRDVRVTKVFYPILLDLARERRTTTYGALVDEAQARNPDDDIIAALIPRAVGRRLLVLRGFTDELGYPDLSSLVLNASTGEVGDAYSDKFDPREKRAEVMAFDWTGRRSRVRCVRRSVRAGDRFAEPTEAKPGGGEASPVGLRERQSESAAAVAAAAGGCTLVSYRR